MPLPFGYAACALTLIKIGVLSPFGQQIALFVGIGCALFVAARAVLALLRPPPRWAPALALDAHHALGDRVTTTLELASLPSAERTGFVAAAIEDGLAVASRLEPRRAVPVRVPAELGLSGLLVLLLGGIAWLEVRTERILPPEASFEPLVMAADDVSLYRDVAGQLLQQAQDPEALAAARRFNALIEDIADRRLDRRDAFQRLGELEAELASKADADKEGRELGLQGLARELSRSGLTKPAADALEQKRLADAEKALRLLAERLRRKEGRPNASELAKLRSALERASRVSAERSAAIEQRRNELREQQKSLLKKPSDPKAAAGAEAKLQENRRKLERLDREKARSDRAQREVSELDRELAKAAEELMKESPQSAESLERGAEDLNRMAKRDLSEQQKRELLQRMRELREVLRQQGQGGADRMQQMKRFGQRARGGRPEGGNEKPGGKGKGQGKGQGQGVETITIPRITQVPVSGPSSGQGQESQGDGAPGEQPAAGKQAGKGHDPNLQGEATALKSQTQDVSAAGIDTGQGTASAEVIYGAAERGFVGKGYRDVYVEYETVAEQALEHDQIPPGYRFYVRRYFQLIRPRE
ncbi:MAG TPA: hypothetical protein VER33_28385 [Polyangiaceae bacterium]|nr:hypothetical protein [Polyangiaceae bacterium]